MNFATILSHNMTCTLNEPCASEIESKGVLKHNEEMTHGFLESAY